MAVRVVYPRRPVERIRGGEAVERGTESPQSLAGIVQAAVVFGKHRPGWLFNLYFCGLIGLACASATR